VLLLLLMMMVRMTGDIVSRGHTTAAGPLMMLDLLLLLKLIDPASVDLIAVLCLVSYLLLMAVKSYKNIYTLSITRSNDLFYY
jgi:hypothetical protein